MLWLLQRVKGATVSYSNPMHHEPGAPARAPIVPSIVSGAAYARVERERDALLALVGRIHNNAAENPEWIRARIDAAIVALADERARA